EPPPKVLRAASNPVRGSGGASPALLRRTFGRDGTNRIDEGPKDRRHLAPLGVAQVVARKGRRPLLQQRHQPPGGNVGGNEEIGREGNADASERRLEPELLAVGDNR